MKHSRLIVVLVTVLAIACLFVWFAGPALNLGGENPLQSSVGRLVLILAILASASLSVLAIWLTADHVVRAPLSETRAQPEDRQVSLRENAETDRSEPESAERSVGDTGEPMRSLGCHGYSIHQRDRISINLPKLFVTVWEDWSRELVREGEAVFGSHWINNYRRSPGYRFVLSAGIAGEDVWAGVMMPSTNSIGECLPLCVAASLPKQVPPLAAFDQLLDWFRSVETLAADVIDEEFDIRTLPDRLQQLSDYRLSIDPVEKTVTEWQSRQNPGGPVSIRLTSSGRAVADLTTPGMLDSLMTQTFCQYSLWTSTSLDRNREVSTFLASGMPLGRHGLGLVSADPSLAGVAVEEHLARHADNSSRQDSEAEKSPQSVDTARVDLVSLGEHLSVPADAAEAKESHTRLVRPGSAEKSPPVTGQVSTKPWKH